MAGRTSAKRVPAKPRSERLEARISSAQKALFQRAAELQGRTLTDFVIASVHESAVKAIAEWEAVRLTAADSRAFAEALLHPREPIPELRAAAERYRKMVGGGSDRDREPTVFALVVDAKDAAAERFYARYRFLHLSAGSRRMFLPITEIAALFS
jgi:uncharacterized protein (DUF1778 family)